VSKQPTVPHREVSRSQAQNYLGKAQQHLAGALESIDRYDTAVLLSVHAAISAADAVAAGLFGIRSVSQNHADQPRLIRQLLPEDGAAERAAEQRAALIDLKNTVEYEARRFKSEEAVVATKRAERVVNWARSALWRVGGPES